MNSLFQAYFLKIPFGVQTISLLVRVKVDRRDCVSDLNIVYHAALAKAT